MSWRRSAGERLEQLGGDGAQPGRGTTSKSQPAVTRCAGNDGRRRAPLQEPRELQGVADARMGRAAEIMVPGRSSWGIMVPWNDS